jgi:LPXTG-motif cell wall-anchored protein
LSPKTYGGAEVIEPLKETPFPWMWLIVLGILLAAIALYLRRRAQ